MRQKGTLPLHKNNKKCLGLFVCYKWQGVFITRYFRKIDEKNYLVLNAMSKRALPQKTCSPRLSGENHLLERLWACFKMRQSRYVNNAPLSRCPLYAKQIVVNTSHCFAVNMKNFKSKTSCLEGYQEYFYLGFLRETISITSSLPISPLQAFPFVCKKSQNVLPSTVANINDKCD